MTIGARKEISHSQPLPLHWQHHRHQPSQPARPNNGNNTLKWESWFALSDKRTRRARGRPPRVCLSSNRVSFSLHLVPSHSFSLFTAFVSPFASLPFTLCACGLRTCARFHSLLFSLFPSLFAFLHPLLYVVRASFFFPSAKRRHPRLVFHRPTERKDCKPPDEPRIPEWGLLYSTVFSGCRKSARARASKPWMNSVLTGTQASAISRGGYLFLSQSAF